MTDLSNSSPINRQALHWLEQAKAETSDQQSYLAQLAAWGLEQSEIRDPPIAPNHPDQHDLTSAIEALLGADPDQATAWFLENPELDPAEQESSLLADLQQAESPQQAAQRAVESAYSVMVAHSPT